MSEIYAVFEGGGVKGIGHVGALAALGWKQPHVVIKGYAGASAGAIVAALAAAGYQAAGPDENAAAGDGTMKAILEKMDFEDLLKDEGLSEVPLQSIETLKNRVEELYKELRGDAERIEESGAIKKVVRWNLLGRKLSRLLKKNQDLRSVFARIEMHKGIYGTRKFRDWIDGLLRAKPHLQDKDGKVTFGSLQKGTGGTILKVVVTDIAGRTIRTYGPGADETPSDEVADAVVASMSIPLFFRPFPFGPNNFYVDGGLLSNFPAWLFDSDPRLPILGVRLVTPAPNPPTDISGTKAYLESLAETTLSGAGFLQFRRIEQFVGVKVEMPRELKAWHFRLSREMKDSLFERGRKGVSDLLNIGKNREVLGLPHETAGSL